MSASSDRSKNWEIYLNDHLAGAQGALELLEDMQSSHDARIAALAERLTREISEDRRQLELVMDRLGVPRERVKQVLASLAESTSRLKLARRGAPAELAHLLELESLSAGIWMKKRLWRSLAAAEGIESILEGIDLDVLAARADRQLDLVEEHRLDQAARAL